MRKRRSRALYLTPEQIRMFQANPAVKHVRENRITLTYEFRTRMYEEWIKDPSVSLIRSYLNKHGLYQDIVGYQFIETLHKSFKRHGQPSSGKNRELYQTQNFRTDPESDALLLSTGKFVKGRNGHGITFAPDFVNELFHSYPERSIEEGLKKAGIAPDIVGYQRIHHLQKSFEGDSTDGIQERQVYTDDVRTALSGNPFVRKVTRAQLSFHGRFFEEARSLAPLHIDEILDIFGIDYSLIPVSVRSNLTYKIKNWRSSGKAMVPPEDPERYVQILRAKMLALEKMVEDGFDALRELVPDISCAGRRYLCLQIRALPSDPGRKYTKKAVLEQVGIPRSSYYAILKDDNYGKYGERKEAQDREDAEVIRRTMEYRGYAKGQRQIYMMMKDVTGKQFGRNRIRRLMNKYGIGSGIRKARQSRIEARRLLKERKKPNLLDRRFRLERPGMIRLTDVTYLEYGQGLRSYCSASIDPVSGRLIDLRASTSNGLALAEGTLDAVVRDGPCPGAVFHSDQGILYLSPEFQKHVAESGMVQSMSRRGNCWDDAAQESFFGHFKDECPYKDAESDEELAAVLADYSDYYNNERKQWARKRMTPVQYEEYLRGLDEEEFARYLAAEQEKYDEMKKKAMKKALARARDLGAPV